MQYAKVAPDQCADDTSRAGKPATPLPVLQLLVLYLVQSCDAINFFQVFPYVSFMVLDMGMVDDIVNAGQYAGYIASAYAFATLLSAYVWGIIADTYGRRFALLSGLSCTMLCTLMFGLSQSFWWAVSWRGCWGLLNGNVGVVKTYISEVTDCTNRAKALLYLGICGGVGRVAGPVIGGFFARPEFGGPLLERDFPYLLPNLLSALLSMLGAIGGYFLLPETLDPQPRASCPADLIQFILRCRNGACCLVERLRRRLGDSVHIDCGMKDAGSGYRVAYGDTSGSDIAHKGEENGDGDSAGSNVNHGLSTAATAESAQATEAAAAKAVPVLPGWGERTVVVAGSLYFAIAVIQSSWMEAFPLWSVTDISDGGLSFHQADLGKIYAVTGLAQVVFSAWLYPPVARRFGPLLCFRAGLLLQMPLYVLLSFYSGIADNRTLLWPLLCAPFISIQTFTVGVYVGVFELISNSTVKERLGAANGVGQTFAALARVTGPLLGSFVIAWSENNRLAAPFDYHFLFVVVLPVLCVGSVCLSCFLPQSIDPEYARRFPHRRDQSEQTKYDTKVLELTRVKFTVMGRAVTESHYADSEFRPADDADDPEVSEETNIELAPPQSNTGMDGKPLPTPRTGT